MPALGRKAPGLDLDDDEAAELIANGLQRRCTANRQRNHETKGRASFHPATSGFDSR